MSRMKSPNSSTNKNHLDTLKLQDIYDITAKVQFLQIMNNTS